MSHIINYRLNQLSWALAALLLLPLLFTKGMFFDGLTYASIARNLNDGIGSFWAPSYTPSVHPTFYEHPPFSFGLHSVFYRLFGDQPWVDRIYPYTMYGVSVLMLRRIWSLFIPAGHRAWIPQLLWTLTPTVVWVHQNNMLEAPLAAATLCVVWLLFEGTIKRNYFWSALAGVVFFFALGIKGPVSLFPLVTLPIMATLYPEHRKAALWSLFTMITSFSALFSYFYLYQPAYSEFFSTYLDRQLLPTLSGDREQSGSALMSVLEVLKQLALPIVVWLIFRFKLGKRYRIQRGSIFFFLIALSGTVPFLFMDRQHHYYFMPTMAFWMLGFGIHLAQNPYPWTIQRSKWVKVFTFANLGIWLVAVVLSLYFSKSPSRDKHLLNAVEYIDENYDPKAIQVSSLSEHWKLVAIAERYSSIHLSEKELEYRLSESNRPLEGEIMVHEFEKANLYLFQKESRTLK